MYYDEERAPTHLCTAKGYGRDVPVYIEEDYGEVAAVYATDGPHEGVLVVVESGTLRPIA